MTSVMGRKITITQLTVSPTESFGQRFPGTMLSLKNNIVCITGASSGIGAACAEEFAKLGCNLMLLARRQDRIEALAHRLSAAHNIKTFTAQLDVRNQKDVEQFFS